MFCCIKMSVRVLCTLYVSYAAICEINDDNYDESVQEYHLMMISDSVLLFGPPCTFAPNTGWCESPGQMYRKRIDIINDFTFYYTAHVFPVFNVFFKFSRVLYLKKRCHRQGLNTCKIQRETFLLDFLFKKVLPLCWWTLRRVLQCDKLREWVSRV